jgi:hypothetical protein
MVLILPDHGISSIAGVGFSLLLRHLKIEGITW